MPIRKRRQPAPSFRRPAPYSGVTGQHAGIGPAKVDLTRLAMFQVCVEDTYDNYVGCRGMDPEAAVFFDADHPMAVAKPYDVRGTFPYTIGQIIVCAKVRTKLGDNPGVASESTGQPADLDEEIDMLTTDEGLPIFWLHIEGGGGALTPRILYDDIAPGDTDKNAWPCKSDMTADTSADKVSLDNTFPGNFRGYGDSHTDFTATNAAKVWTTVDLAGKEQIVTGIGLAKTIIVANTASGHAAVAKTTTSFTATFTRVCDDGQPPTVSSPATLVVDNSGFAIDDNLADIVCVMDVGGSHLYRVLDAKCPA